MKDAWALGGDEGRDKLRKAAGRSKYPSIRRCPNGATHRLHAGTSPMEERTRGTETSQYPEEEKNKPMIAQVVASERARAQTGRVSARTGVVGPSTNGQRAHSRTFWKGGPQRVRAP